MSQLTFRSVRQSERNFLTSWKRSFRGMNGWNLYARIIRPENFGVYVADFCTACDRRSHHYV